MIFPGNENNFKALPLISGSFLDVNIIAFQSCAKAEIQKVPESLLHEEFSYWESKAWCLETKSRCFLVFTAVQFFGDYILLFNCMFI